MLVNELTRCSARSSWLLRDSSTLQDRWGRSADNRGRHPGSERWSARMMDAALINSAGCRMSTPAENRTTNAN